MLKLLTNGRILLGFLITALGYGGTFVTFTYLTPILQDVTNISPSLISIVLLVYGIAVAVGNWAGGKFANENPAKALFYMFIVHAAVMIVMSFMIPFKVAGLIAIMLMGLLAFMNVPGLQLYIVQLAEKYVPAAVDVASALNIAAFNIGIALGATIGGIVADSIGLVHTPWIGGLMVILAAILTAVSRRLEAK